MQLTMEILRQAGDVPVIFSIVSRSGFVFLEEFTDATRSLEWDLEALQGLPTPCATEEEVLEEAEEPMQVDEEFIDPLFVADWTQDDVLVDSHSDEVFPPVEVTAAGVAEDEEAAALLLELTAEDRAVLAE